MSTSERSRADQPLDLPRRDHGKQANEKEKTGKKQTEAADERADFNDRRPVDHPARWQVAAVQRGHDDDETLEPHSHVDEHGYDEQTRRARTQAAHPEEL